LSKRPKNEPSAPAFTSNPAPTSTHPSTSAEALLSPSVVTLATAPAFKESVVDTLASRSRNTVASAIPPRAETPRSIVGIRWAATVADELTDGLTESLRAGIKKSVGSTIQEQRATHTTIKRTETTIGSGIVRGREEEFGILDVVSEVDGQLGVNVEVCGSLTLDFEAGTKSQDSGWTTSVIMITSNGEIRTQGSQVQEYQLRTN